MRKTRLGAAIMGLLGKVFGAKAQKDEQILKRAKELEYSREYQRSRGASRRITSQRNCRPASMPEYYGFRKQPIWAENKKGERVQVSVKTALKKGFKMLTLPQD